MSKFAFIEPTHTVEEFAYIVSNQPVEELECIVATHTIEDFAAQYCDPGTKVTIVKNPNGDGSQHPTDLLITWKLDGQTYNGSVSHKITSKADISSGNNMISIFQDPERIGNYVVLLHKEAIKSDDSFVTINEIEGFAKYYFSLGMNVTCIGSIVNEHNINYNDILKTPNHKWKHLIVAKQRESEFKSYDWRNATGVGCTTGYNDLRVIDIDGCSDYNFLQEILKTLGLPINYEWVTISGSNNGFHIYINCSKFTYLKDNQVVTTFPPKSEYVKQFEKIEILWNLQTVLPPSLHKTGNKYQFLNCEKPLSSPRLVTLNYVKDLISQYLQAEKKVIGLSYGEELVEFIPPITLTEILKKLINEHGSEILQQHQRIKAILSDLLPNEKRIKYLLELSLRAEIPQKLLSIFENDRSVWEVQINSIKQYFKDDFFLEDKAVKSIFDCWEEVLLKKNIEKNIVTDIDGNIYHTIRIGEKTWMVENLKTTRFSNGDIIETTNSEKNIVDEFEPKYQWSYDEDEKNVEKYGRLYTCSAANDPRNIGPVGWRVPTTDDWDDLKKSIIENGFNYDEIHTENKIAKSIAANTDWKYFEDINSIGNDLSENNDSGFSALPSGYRDFKQCSFYNIGISAYFWSSLMDKDLNGTFYHLNNDKCDLNNGWTSNKYGFSVRCVRDN